MEELVFAARYPFTKAAKELIVGKEVSVGYELMQRVKRRVVAAIKSSIPTIDTHEKMILENEILSYPISRMVVSQLDRSFLNRYVNSETKRAVSYLRENEEDIERVAKEFGIERRDWSVRVRDYLKNIPKIRESRLVYQNILKGFVLLDENGFFLIISEAIRKSILFGLPVRKENIPSEIAGYVEEVAKEVGEETKEIKFERKEVAPAGEMPPCMTAIMNSLKAGEKVTHNARWAIATYLLKRGFDTEAIVSLFSATPNFNEKITRYQIEFIKKKGYTPPSCMTLDSFGLCNVRCNTKNPLQYRGRYGRK